MDDDELRASCRRELCWHGRRTAAQLLQELPEDVEADVYGDGGVVGELEERMALLLGHEAAVFMPSGTMAQQVALRIHADARGLQTVAWHPTSHPQLHEGQALTRLHGLVGRTVGDPQALLTLDDLEEVAEPLAALLLELPQREIGGRLPAWDDLVAQVEWARSRGAAVHLDGARLWECTPHYDCPPATIAGLFDSVYVSFYKGLGGIAGACLAGDADVVAQAREWRHRHGGTTFAMWPLAASALAALDLRLPRMPAYHQHAVAIAAALAPVDGVDVVPDPPVTPLMHLHLRTSAEAFTEATRSLAREQGVWTWQRCWPSGHDGWQVVELTVGDATLELTPDEVAGLVARLVKTSRA